MTKFRNRKRAVFTLAFVALSSLALAPGFVHRGPSAAAALEHTQPHLQEPVIRLAPPHFRMELPEPDYTVSALPPRLEMAAVDAGDAPDFDIVSRGERTLTGIRPLWMSQIGGGGSARNTVAGDIGGAGRTPVTTTNSSSAPQDRSAETAADEAQPENGQPAEETPPQPTELAGGDLPGKGDVPAADDLHNPLNPPATPNGKPDQPAVAVPEPSALALLLAGVIGLVVCRRRSR